MSREPLNIVAVTPELTPFGKTGGIADQCAGVGKGLSEAGHKVSAIVPFHRRCQLPGAPEPDDTGVRLTTRCGGEEVTCELKRCELPGSAVQVFLIDCPVFFDRSGIYGDSAGEAYADNCRRFVAFSRFAVQAVCELGLKPDVLHANDWTTGMVPASLAFGPEKNGKQAPIGTVFTIQNLMHQGLFPPESFELADLSRDFFHPEYFEFFGQFSLLKAGIVSAHRITTVSPSYASEIQTPEFGERMDGVIVSRRDKLDGILNGVDTSVWNPKTDPCIATRYSIADWRRGKAACKDDLQMRTGLMRDPKSPLLGMVARLDQQKGVDIVVDCAAEIIEAGAQLCILGKGEQSLENALRQLGGRFPRRIAVNIDFDDDAAHRIEAGADAFLMPSRFEPCGLNQMYSMIYGTLPIVHHVGGLKDTVIDSELGAPGRNGANGFAFTNMSHRSFLQCVQRCLSMYRENPVEWELRVRNGMCHDWSWARQVPAYENVYRQAVARLAIA